MPEEFRKKRLTQDNPQPQSPRANTRPRLSTYPPSLISLCCRVAVSLCPLCRLQTKSSVAVYVEVEAELVVAVVLVLVVETLVMVVKVDGRVDIEQTQRRRKRFVTPPTIRCVQCGRVQAQRAVTHCRSWLAGPKSSNCEWQKNRDFELTRLGLVGNRAPPWLAWPVLAPSDAIYHFYHYALRAYMHRTHSHQVTHSHKHNAINLLTRAPATLTTLAALTVLALAGHLKGCCIVTRMIQI